MSRILVLGATSAIGRALSDRLASEGNRLLLASRDSAELAAQAADLQIRHRVDVDFDALDALDFPSHPAFVERTVRTLGGLDGVVLAIGQLGTQPKDSQEPSSAVELVQVNFAGPVSLLSLLANRFESQGSGFILALTSVAGDRGRKSNYAYGAAKGGLSLFLGGLAHRLATKDIRVVIVKPGFVDTEMTWGLPGLFLVASPRRVAQLALRKLEKKSGTYYVPGFWRPIMFIIRNIPEFVFRKLDL